MSIWMGSSKTSTRSARKEKPTEAPGMTVGFIPASFTLKSGCG